jgi:hypothetical protein
MEPPPEQLLMLMHATADPTFSHTEDTLAYELEWRASKYLILHCNYLLLHPPAPAARFFDIAINLLGQLSSARFSRELTRDELVLCARLYCSLIFRCSDRHITAVHDLCHTLLALTGGAGLEECLPALSDGIRSANFRVALRSIQTYHRLATWLVPSAIAGDLQAGYARVAVPYFTADFRSCGPCLSALFAITGEFGPFSWQILHSLDFLPLTAALRFLEFFVGLEDRPAVVRRVAIDAAGLLCHAFCDCLTVRDRPEFDIEIWLRAVFAAADADRDVGQLQQFANRVLRQERTPRTGSVAVLRTVALPDDLLGPVVSWLHFRCRLRPSHAADLAERPSELWFSVYEFCDSWADCCDRMAALLVFGILLQQFGVGTVFGQIAGLPIADELDLESLIRIVAHLLELTRDEAVLGFAVRLLAEAAGDLWPIHFARAFLFTKVLPLLGGLETELIQGAIDLAIFFTDRDNPWGEDGFPLAFTIGCGLVEQLMARVDLPPEMFQRVCESAEDCLSSTSASIVACAIETNKIEVSPDFPFENMVGGFEEAINALKFDADGGSEVEGAESLLVEMEKILKQIRTILAVGGTRAQLECCHRLFIACCRYLHDQIMPLVCTVFGACFKAAIRLGVADAFEQFMTDWAICWRFQPGPYCYATDFLPPLFAIFEAGWSSVGLDVRIGLFRKITEERVFLMETDDDEIEWTTQLSPPDAIHAITFLCRLLQSIGGGDEAVLELFRSLLPAVEIVTDVFIGRLLKAEMEMSLVFVGWRPPEQEFAAWLGEIVESGVIISNYHRALLLHVVDLVQGSYPNLGDISELRARLLNGLLAGEEEVAALRRTESAEVFDQYTSPVSETPIEAFVVLDLWD